LRNLSRGPAQPYAEELQAYIATNWHDLGRPDRVTLVGHSLGGILVRQAYLLAAGKYPGVPASDIEWASHVERFVLFASVNNGLEQTRLRIDQRLAIKVAWATGILRLFTGRDFLRGSDAITNLRILWIRHFAHLEENDLPIPVVVQLLGDNDGVVTHEDSMDVEAFRRARHLPVPNATHGNLFRLDVLPSEEERNARYALLKLAFVIEPDVPEQEASPPPPDTVVFVLHGIRVPNATWETQVKDLVKTSLGARVEVVTSGYGYFSALGFAFPLTRRRRIGWFQNQYSYYLAEYPRARFLFLGHSNGTYLLGHSLRKLSGMKFERVVLAGSVLPREYPWRSLKEGQVGRLRNDRARKDWPVALLCNGLRGLGMKDVGTGGYSGFNENDGTTDEVRWHDGGHGKALEEENLPDLVEYLLDNNPMPDQPNPNLEPSKVFGLASRAMPVVFPILLAANVAATGLVARRMITGDTSGAAFKPALVAVVALNGVVPLVLKIL
jgi:pimeloyl-ACP methyl ester carboxylesterase